MKIYRFTDVITGDEWLYKKLYDGCAKLGINIQSIRNLKSARREEKGPLMLLHKNWKIEEIEVK